MFKKRAVNYYGFEEKKKLIEYLEKEGFDLIDFSYSGRENYGFLVNFEDKVFFSMQPAFMAAACSGLRPISVNQFIKFFEFIKNPDRRKIIVHIPHAGNVFPDDIELFIDEEEKMRQQIALKDHYVVDMIPLLCDYLIKFDCSRIVCDVERFQENEPMEKYGMGFCYMKGYNGRYIRNPDDKNNSKEKELELYKAHHKNFSDICEKNKKLFILDLHSYSEKIIPADMIKKEKALPDICLGFDPKYMNSDIIKIAAERFLNKGFTVGFNYPYSGSFVPKEVLDSPEEYDCISLMIEVNRNVIEYGYYDSKTLCAAGQIREIIDEILLYAVTGEETFL